MEHDQLMKTYITTTKLPVKNDGRGGTATMVPAPILS